MELVQRTTSLRWREREKKRTMRCPDLMDFPLNISPDYQWRTGVPGVDQGRFVPSFVPEEATVTRYQATEFF